MTRILRLLRNKVLGSVANAGICPMSLRLLLLRLCGWRIAPGTHLFSARFLNGQIQVGDGHVASHGGRGPLCFRDRAARDDDAVPGGRQGARGSCADPAVAARDDDSHPAIIQCFRQARSGFG